MVTTEESGAAADSVIVPPPSTPPSLPIPITKPAEAQSLGFQRVSGESDTAYLSRVNRIIGAVEPIRQPVVTTDIKIDLGVKELQPVEEKKIKATQPGLPRTVAELTPEQMEERNAILAERDAQIIPLQAQIDSAKARISELQDVLDANQQQVPQDLTPEEQAVWQGDPAKVAAYNAAFSEQSNLQQALPQLQNQYDSLVNFYSAKLLASAGYVFPYTGATAEQIKQASEQTVALSKGGETAFNYAKEHNLIPGDAIYVPKEGAGVSYTTPDRLQQQINTLVSAGVLDTQKLKDLGTIGADTPAKLQTYVEQYNTSQFQNTINTLVTAGVLDTNALKDIGSDPTKIQSYVDKYNAAQTQNTINALVNAGVLDSEKLKELATLSPEAQRLKLQNYVIEANTAITTGTSALNQNQATIASNISRLQSIPNVGDVLAHTYSQAAATQPNSPEWKIWNDTWNNYQQANIQNALNSIPNISPADRDYLQSLSVSNPDAFYASVSNVIAGINLRNLEEVKSQINTLNVSQETKDYLVSVAERQPSVLPSVISNVVGIQTQKQLATYPKELQDAYAKGGIEALNKAIDNYNVKVAQIQADYNAFQDKVKSGEIIALPDGNYINKSDFDKQPQGLQQIIKTEGFSGYLKQQQSYSDILSRADAAQKAAMESVVKQPGEDDATYKLRVFRQANIGLYDFANKLSPTDKKLYEEALNQQRIGLLESIPISVLPPLKVIKPEYTLKDVTAKEWVEGGVNVALLLTPAIGELGTAGRVASAVIQAGAGGLYTADTIKTNIDMINGTTPLSVPRLALSYGMDALLLAGAGFTAKGANLAESAQRTIAESLKPTEIPLTIRVGEGISSVKTFVKDIPNRVMSTPEAVNYYLTVAQLKASDIAELAKKGLLEVTPEVAQRIATNIRFAGENVAQRIMSTPEAINYYVTELGLKADELLKVSSAGLLRVSQETANAVAGAVKAGATELKTAVMNTPQAIRYYTQVLGLKASEVANLVEKGLLEVAPEVAERIALDIKNSGVAFLDKIMSIPEAVDYYTHSLGIKVADLADLSKKGLLQVSRTTANRIADVINKAYALDQKIAEFPSFIEYYAKELKLNAEDIVALASKRLPELTKAGVDKVVELVKTGAKKIENIPDAIVYYSKEVASEVRYIPERIGNKIQSTIDEIYTAMVNKDKATAIAKARELESLSTQLDDVNLSELLKTKAQDIQKNFDNYIKLAEKEASNPDVVEGVTNTSKNLLDMDKLLAETRPYTAELKTAAEFKPKLGETRPYKYGEVQPIAGTVAELRGGLEATQEQIALMRNIANDTKALNELQQSGIIEPYYMNQLTNRINSNLTKLSEINKVAIEDFSFLDALQKRLIDLGYTTDEISRMGYDDMLGIVAEDRLPPTAGKPKEELPPSIEPGGGVSVKEKVKPETKPMSPEEIEKLMKEKETKVEPKPSEKAAEKPPAEKKPSEAPPLEERQVFLPAPMTGSPYYALVWEGGKVFVKRVNPDQLPFGIVKGTTDVAVSPLLAGVTPPSTIIPGVVVQPTPQPKPLIVPEIMPTTPTEPAKITPIGEPLKIEEPQKLTEITPTPLVVTEEAVKPKEVTEAPIVEPAIAPAITPAPEVTPKVSISPAVALAPAVATQLTTLTTPELVMAGAAADTMPVPYPAPFPTPVTQIPKPVATKIEITTKPPLPIPLPKKKREITEEKKVARIKEGTVVWVQGSPKGGRMYRVIVPPYQQGDSFSMRTLPPGYRDEGWTGEGSAKASLQVIGGLPEKDIENIDLGWTRINIRVSSGKPEIEYVHDADANVGERSKTVGQGKGQIPIQAWEEAKSKGVAYDDFVRSYAGELVDGKQQTQTESVAKVEPITPKAPKDETKNKHVYEELVALAESYGFKVEEVPYYQLKDYAAMNPDFAKTIGYDMPSDTIQLNSEYNTTYADKADNLWHELDEMGKIEKGDKYWQAHTDALHGEKTPSVETVTMPKPLPEAPVHEAKETPQKQVTEQTQPEEDVTVVQSYIRRKKPEKNWWDSPNKKPDNRILIARSRAGRSILPPMINL